MPTYLECAVMGRDLILRAFTPVAMLLLAIGSARAADVETRTFAVSVNGKTCGNYQMVIQVHEDGSQEMSAEAIVQAPQAAGWYLYGYRGKESWRDGRLQKLEAGSNDEGKKRLI